MGVPLDPAVVKGSVGRGVHRRQQGSSRGLVTKSTEEIFRIGFRITHVDPKGPKAGAQLNRREVGGATSVVDRGLLQRQAEVRQRHGSGWMALGPPGSQAAFARSDLAGR